MKLSFLRSLRCFMRINNLVTTDYFPEMRNLFSSLRTFRYYIYSTVILLTYPTIPYSGNPGTGGPRRGVANNVLNGYRSQIDINNPEILSQ